MSGDTGARITLPFILTYIGHTPIEIKQRRHYVLFCNNIQMYFSFSLDKYARIEMKDTYQRFIVQ